MASQRERVILLLKFVWYGEVFFSITKEKRLSRQSKTGLPEEKTEELDMAFYPLSSTFIILPKATLP